MYVSSQLKTLLFLSVNHRQVRLLLAICHPDLACTCLRTSPEVVDAPIFFFSCKTSTPFNKLGHLWVNYFVCISITSGVSPGQGRTTWHTACPHICLAFLMNIIGSDKNI